MSNLPPLYPPQERVNGIDAGLFPFDVTQMFVIEYVQSAPLISSFGGRETTRPIVIHNVKPGSGWQYRVPKINALDYSNPVVDFDQVSSAGQSQSVDSCPVDIHGYSYPLILRGKELVDFGTPLDLPSQIRPQLMEACTRGLVKFLLDSATYDPLNLRKQYCPYQDLENTKPSYDRVIFGGYRPTRNGYNNFNGIRGALNGLADGPAYNENGLSAVHLLTLREMALAGGVQDSGAVLVNNGIEDRIRPAYVKSRAGFPIYNWIYLASPTAMKSLLADPDYQRVTTARGAVVSEEQPEAVSGATYRGNYEGIMLYEIAELSHYNVLSENQNILASWGMLIGGAAWSLGWAENPTIAFKNNVIDRIQEFTTHEIRGHRSLMYPSRQFYETGDGPELVEQGIIHSFTRINP